MAWLDDRIWCHPKVTDLTSAAFRAYVNGIAYSSGFDTGGTLTLGQQRQVGSDAKTRRELVTAGLWDDVDGKAVKVHDWDEHNGKRDEKRRQDRDRKRRQREREAADESRGQERDNTRDTSRDTQRDKARTVPRARDHAGARPMTGDGSKELTRAVTEVHYDEPPPDDDEPLVATTERPSDFTIADTINESLRKASR